MFILFAIFMTAQGSISATTAEFTNQQSCEDAKAILQTNNGANKSLVCVAK